MSLEKLSSLNKYHLEILAIKYNVIVNVSNQQTELKISVNQVRQLVREVIKKERQICSEVNIYFVNTSIIMQLHEQFFDDPSPTDCISFPMDKKEEEKIYSYLLGEVFICPATAIAYAARHVGDPYKETTLYLVHGLLHLMGYNDLEEQDIILMRQAEKRHMQHLQKLNLQLQAPANNPFKSRPLRRLFK